MSSAPSNDNNNNYEDGTTTTVHLHVDGMMCQRNCGTTVENALRGLPGVISAGATFATKSAWATYHNNTTTTGTTTTTRPTDLVEAIEMIGFDAKLQTTTINLNVEGMMCQRNCGTTVENALRNVPGVLEAGASFATKSAWATVLMMSEDNSNDNIGNRLVETIEDIGFDASLKTTTKIYVQVEGMMCQRNCGTTVRNAILQVPGVLEAESSFQYSQAWAEVPLKEEGDNIGEEICDAIECIGFEATLISSEEEALKQRNEKDEQEKLSQPTSPPPPPPPPPANDSNNVIVLSVEGMSCAVCTGRVERALMQVPGVTSAFVSLATHRAEVTFDQDDNDDDDAVEAVAVASQEAVQKGAGYPCEILSAGGSGNPMTLQENVKTLEDAKHSELKAWRNLLILAITLLTPMLWLKRRMSHMMLEDTTINDYHHSTTTTTTTTTNYSMGMVDDNNNSTNTFMDDDMMMPSSSQNYHLSTCMGQYMFVMFILSTLVQSLVGYRYYKAAWKAGTDFGMDFLVVLGTTSSYVYSVGVWMYLLVAADESHTAPDDTTLEPTFGTGAMLLTFVTFGKFLEAYAKGKTSSALEALMKLQPQWASRIKKEGLEGWEDTTLVSSSSSFDVDTAIESGNQQEDKEPQEIQVAALETEEVDTCNVKVGEYVRVLPGARIPTDGVIVAMSSSSSSGNNSSSRGNSPRSLDDSASNGSSSSSNNKKHRAVAYIDESAFSGEPFPVPKSIGDHVYGSSVNQLSVLVVRVTATGSNSVLAKIVRLMEDAQRNKAPIQALADQIASVFAPAVMGLAVITFVLWVILDSEVESNEERLFLAFLSAISVIVVACPCALGLATPTAVMVGTGVGATHGLLIKGGSVLESMQSVDTLIFDKTGTITTGKAVLGEHKELVQDPQDLILRCVPSKVLSNKGSSEHCLALWLAACAENQSEHPLAKAVVNAAKARWGGDVTCSHEGVTVSDFEVTPGFGVECVVAKPQWGTYTVRVGNKQWAQEPVKDDTDGSLVEKMGPKDTTGDREVSELRELGQIGVYVSVLKSPEESIPDFLGVEPIGSVQTSTQRQRRVIGVLGVVDPIREQAKSAIAALKGLGIEVHLLTGDHEKTAKAVARQVGIDEENVCAGVKPEEKGEYVGQLQDRLGHVGFVGDGINDSIALAKANVGIAIGAGTEVAVEAADIVLVRSNLHDVVVAYHLSKVVFRRIRMNFVWAMLYNLLALPFAAGILYPFTDFRLPPEYAGLMMAFSSVSVVTSSLLLRNYKRPGIHSDGTLEGGSGILSVLMDSCEHRRRRPKTAKYESVSTLMSPTAAATHKELELV